MSDSEAKSGFLDRIFSILGKASDPERDKKRQLKDINKRLKKHKFKFFRPKQEEALAALAKFFYEIYSII